MKSKRITMHLLSLTIVISIVSCKNNKTSEQEADDAPVACRLNSDAAIISKENGTFNAYKTKSSVKIDGCSNDPIWKNADWYDMNYIWMGEAVDSIDYHGKFKLAWDSEYLYVLVEVMDDVLHPTLADGRENYWKGDYVEVFIDEDQSGGNHQFNHQAFAYHVSTEGHAIDKNTAEETVFFDEHVNVARSQEGNSYLWEMAIRLFDDGFDETALDSAPVEITAQKSIGFSIAYGDNDGNQNRENFMGSRKTHGVNNDEGYVNSDVFGSILFLE